MVTGAAGSGRGRPSCLRRFDRKRRPTELADPSGGVLPQPRRVSRNNAVVPPPTLSDNRTRNNEVTSTSNDKTRAGGVLVAGRPWGVLLNGRTRKLVPPPILRSMDTRTQGATGKKNTRAKMGGGSGHRGVEKSRGWVQWFETERGDFFIGCTRNSSKWISTGHFCVHDLKFCGNGMGLLSRTYHPSLTKGGVEKIMSDHHQVDLIRSSTKPGSFTDHARQENGQFLETNSATTLVVTVNNTNFRPDSY